MLQITIVHTKYPNYTTWISEIKELDTDNVLSVFDPEIKKINLSVVENHVGEPIMIVHYIKQEDNTLEFESKEQKTLRSYGKSEATGEMSINYN